jgi:hypothetical protein
MELGHVIDKLGVPLPTSKVDLRGESRVFSIHVKNRVGFTRKGAKLLATPRREGEKESAGASGRKKRESVAHLNLLLSSGYPVGRDSNLTTGWGHLYYPRNYYFWNTSLTRV